MSVGGAYGRVLVVGDSVTWGSVASLPNNAYPWQVISGLRTRNGSASFYLTDGQPGINTAGAITALQQMNIAQPAADLIVVELGVNDWGQNTQPSTFQAQYVSLLELLLAKSQAATLVGLTCWQDPNALNNISQAASIYSSIISDAVLNKSGAKQTAVVDLAPLYLTGAYHNATGDVYHPNDAGHAAIGAAILGRV